MRSRNLNCLQMEAKLPDLLFDPASVPAPVRAHLEDCPACRAELAGLRATMAAMDAWEAPEPSPYFDGKLHARLRAERAEAPAGWLERLRSRMLYGGSLHLRPIAAAALAALLAVGGGTAFWVEHDGIRPRVQESATVRDLQSFDGNAQLFQQLNSLDSDEDGSAANTAHQSTD